MCARGGTHGAYIMESQTRTKYSFCGVARFLLVIFFFFFFPILLCTRVLYRPTKSRRCRIRYTQHKTLPYSYRRRLLLYYYFIFTPSEKVSRGRTRRQVMDRNTIQERIKHTYTYTHTHTYINVFICVRVLQHVPIIFVLFALFFSLFFHIFYFFPRVPIHIVYTRLFCAVDTSASPSDCQMYGFPLRDYNTALSR